VRVITVARKPLPKGGTVAANLLQEGVGCLHVNACRVALQGETPPSVNRRAAAQKTGRAGSYTQGVPSSVAHLSGKIGSNKDPQKALAFYTRDRPGEHLGRWPPNVVLSSWAAGQLDQQIGSCRSPKAYTRSTTSETRVAYGGSSEGDLVGYGDFGGVSRFFTVISCE
jgi:hypothetical protein